MLAKKEAENVQAMLSQRVQKPSLKDYKIQYAMKSYFQDEINEMGGIGHQQAKNGKEENNQLTVSNAGIYKRAEKLGY
jgi:uncharacterized protein involved in exopolysaccharide biosynthesis